MEGWKDLGTSSSASAGPLADHDVGCDVTVGALSGACSRHPQRTPGTQAGDEPARERPASVGAEGPGDRLVRMCVEASSGTSVLSRRKICSGPHDVAHRRS
jgi:hypothetical protein